MWLILLESGEETHINKIVTTRPDGYIPKKAHCKSFKFVFGYYICGVQYPTYYTNGMNSKFRSKLSWDVIFGQKCANIAFECIVFVCYHIYLKVKFRGT